MGAGQCSGALSTQVSSQQDVLNADMSQLLMMMHFHKHIQVVQLLTTAPNASIPILN